MPLRTLSSKAKGKRPMHGPNASKATSLRAHASSENVDDTDEYNSVASGSASVSSRRVQPARARRGMSANALLGANEVDKKLLDTLRRKSESEPLIPARTPFILTTDASLLASSSKKVGLSLNTDAEQFYFERPEVIQSIRAQQEVQSAEFKELRDADLISGRLRFKGDTEPPELSDAAFAKRHVRYEKIERKQKAREKEQLHFEHFKLRERIDQLRNMDTAPFLSLPAESFVDTDTEVVVEKPTSVSHVGFGLSAAAHQEGERRRHIILRVASSLDERYRMLLPPKSDGRREAVSHESSEAEFDEKVDDDETSHDRQSEPDEDVEMAEEEANEDEEVVVVEEPPSPARAPKKLKPSRATPSLPRQSRKSTPSSDIDVRAPRPREGVFDRNMASASLVLKEKPAENGRPAPARTRRQLATTTQDGRFVQVNPSPPVPLAPAQSHPYVVHPSTSQVQPQNHAQPPPTTTQPLSVPLLYTQATQNQRMLPSLSATLVQTPELHRLFTSYGAQLQNIFPVSGNMSAAELQSAMKTFEVMQKQYKFPPFAPHSRAPTPLASGSGMGCGAHAQQGHQRRQGSTTPMTIEVNAPSTPSDDVAPPPFSPVPVLPDSENERNHEHDAPSEVFGNRSEYDFEQQRRFRATDAGDSDSYVADSLSRSSVPRTSASLDGPSRNHAYAHNSRYPSSDRHLSTPATGASSALLLPDPDADHGGGGSSSAALSAAGPDSHYDEAQLAALEASGQILAAWSYTPDLTPTGRLRRWRAGLLQVSKHNALHASSTTTPTTNSDRDAEPRGGRGARGARGARTNPRPFGIENPLEEPGPGVRVEAFGLPRWVLQDVALLRAGGFSRSRRRSQERGGSVGAGAGADGSESGGEASPLVKAEDLEEGEWVHGSFSRSEYSEQGEGEEHAHADGEGEGEGSEGAGESGSGLGLDLDVEGRRVSRRKRRPRQDRL